MRIKTLTRAEQLVRASVTLPKRFGCSAEHHLMVEPVFADRSLYVATRAGYVPRPTAHGVPVGINTGGTTMRSKQSRLQEGYIHTPAAFRLPPKTPRKWRPALQMPLPLPEPRPLKRGHNQTTRELGGCQ